MFACRKPRLIKALTVPFFLNKLEIIWLRNLSILNQWFKEFSERKY